MQTSLKLIEVEQGSHEWLAARLGIITASNAGLLLTAGKGEGGKADAGTGGHHQGQAPSKKMLQAALSRASSPRRSSTSLSSVLAIQGTAERSRQASRASASWSAST